MVPRLKVVAFLAAVLLAASVSPAAFLGTTGGLKGKITDVSSGEPLPGVNVLIVGSGRGAVTNDKGEYSVTGVTQGTYTLRVSLLGYKTISTEKNVLIEADETAVYNFKMASEDIEMDPVIAIGTRPLVDVGKTAGEQTFNKDKIEQLPNVKGAEDVIGLTSGVVKFGGQMFLRGGRANETQILIDGVAVNDVGAGATQQANEQLSQLYSGNSTAGVGGALSVSANAIQSVSVSSSGLDAEYGNAQSGIVNITTKSGGDSYNGSFQYRTDSPTPQSYNENYFAANLGGPEPITAYLLPSMGVQVPGKLSFFMSANFNQYDGPYDFTKGNFYNPLTRKVKFSGFLGDLLNGLGFTYSDRQANTFSFNTKVSYAIGESDQFSYSYRANTSSSHPLYGSFTWRDRRDSTLSDVDLVDQNVIQWTHVFGTNSLLRGYVSRLSTDRTSSVGGLDPTSYTFVEPGQRDPSEDGFNDIGTSQSWSSSNTEVWNAKFNFDSQIHRLHFLKTGFEYFYENVRSTSISFPADNPEDPVELSYRGDFPGVGRVRWVSSNLPSRGALFLQDNIEFKSINIRLGLRYDFFYLGNQVFDPAYIARWEDVTGQQADWLENKSFFSQMVRGAFSPRLAIGYPISRSTVFYFNYGHFLQYPERDQLYHDPVPTAIANNYVGNPSLKPQKTVQYEAGFDQLIFDDLSLGIRGFYKDIFDYVAFKRTLVDLYVNLDYASARGFEVIVTKQLRERWSGSLGYTFQLAKGRSSDPRAAQLSPALFGLPREVRLDWDQQHTLNVFLGYRVGPKEELDVFGLNIDNWGASMTWNYGSGFPYTPFNPNVKRNSLEELYLKNTGDGPLTSEVNFSLYKGFTIIDKLNLTFTMDITNLLNRRNVDLNAGGFNSLTGRPIVYGDFTPVSRDKYPWGAELNNASFAARVPPYIFRSPRQIAFGIRINWE
jgi:outer membrane receptor protein involved in Fe transport